MNKKNTLNLLKDVNEIKETTIPGLQTDVEGLKNKVPELKAITVANNIATLTNDKYQETTLADGNSIVLPTVTKFTEIHLFFDTTSAMNITFPVGVAWQNGEKPIIEANKHYELVFTYRNSLWLGGYIEYIG